MTKCECKVMEYKNKMHVIDTCRRVTPPLRLSRSSNWWMIENPFLFVFLYWNIINKLCLCFICVVYIWRKNATDQHCLVACCVGVVSGTEKPLQLWLKSFVSFHFMKWILTVDTHLTPMRALSSSLLHLRSQRPATYNFNEMKSFLSTKIIENILREVTETSNLQLKTNLNYWYPPFTFSQQSYTS